MGTINQLGYRLGAPHCSLRRPAHLVEKLDTSCKLDDYLVLPKNVKIYLYVQLNVYIYIHINCNILIYLFFYSFHCGGIDLVAVKDLYHKDTAPLQVREPLCISLKEYPYTSDGTRTHTHTDTHTNIHIYIYTHIKNT